MYHLLCPRLMTDSVYHIDFGALRSQGIRGIIFDLDNTIIPWDSAAMCPELSQWFQKLLMNDFKVVIVSNNWHKRVKAIADLFGIPFVSRARKPAKSGFRQALARMDMEPAEVAVIGDQLFTDVLGGNRLGLYTIWVKPINTKEFVGTRITRQFEKLAVHILKTKGLLK